MSDTQTTEPVQDEPELSEDGEKVTISKAAWENVKSAADRKDGGAAEREALKRELAFLKAGVDVDSKAGQLLLKAYDGELTSEAIKAEAEAIGALKGAGAPAAAAAEPEGPELEPGEADQTAERRSLSAGASKPDGQPQGDPYQDAQKVFEQAQAAGATREAAGATWIGEVMGSKDKRTYVTDPDRQGFDVL